MFQLNHIKRNMVVVTLLLTIFGVEAVASCMDLPWRRGKPYDYYASNTREKNGTYPSGLLSMVESAHFDPRVQMLFKGKSGAQPQDLLFVLTSIPNHPAALDAYSRYVKKYSDSSVFRSDKMTQRPKYTPECFFMKAMKTYPDRAETFKVWAMHLYREGSYDKSIEALHSAMSLGDNGADVHYHLGMSYFSLGDLDSARNHAQKAYAAGYPFQGLKQKLEGKF